ncbi:MAG: TonB-dependent receptor [Bacteroidota bacterium]|nr:TonB-dependent receptor [Bacteroidota bacterium]
MKKFLLLLLWLVTLLPSQQERQTGVIEGMVVNETTKEPISGANIQIIGTPLGVTTDKEGMFTINQVPIGMYQVRASILGFTSLIRTDVVVAVGKQTKVNFELIESLLEFEGVTVTTDYFQKSHDAPISIQTLDAEEIRRLPGGFEDVLRAVSILPGVAQVQTGRNDIIARGGSPSENLFVIDNIEVANINHFGTQGAGGGPLSFVNLDFINETTFRTGGFSVQYGDKLSSVLTIDLKDGRTDRFGGKATISASQFGLNLEGPTNHEGSFLFSARRSYLDFIFKAAGFGFVPEYWDFLGKINYKLSSADQLNILGIAALDNVKLFNDTEEKRLDNSRILYSAQNQFIGGASWRHLLNRGFSTVTISQTYYGYQYRQDDSLTNPIFKNISDEYETTFRADVVLQAGKETEISFGALGKFIDFQSRIILPLFWTNFGQRLSADAKLDTTAWKSAGYAQLSHSLWHNFRFTLGGRLDYFNLIKNDVTFSPRMSVSYAASPVTTLTLSIGNYHQAPSYVWLVANASNRNLNFISVNQYITGIEYFLRSDIKASVESYIKNYSQYPASVARPYLVLANAGGFGGSEEGFASFGLDPLISEGSGRSQGIELCLQKKFSDEPWYGLLSITYNESRFKAIDGIEHPFTFDQRWILNLGGGYILDEAWEFSGKFRFVTGRPYTPYNADGTQNMNELYSARVGINHSLDLRADRRWNFERWNLITYVDVQNVYNRIPLQTPVFDEQAKEVRQPKGVIGLLPSIGISAEW